MDQGRLRDEVRVGVMGDDVIVHHQFMDLALPRVWVQETPDIQSILNREITVDQSLSEDKQVKGVIEFLRLQGCFFHSRAKTEYSLQEIKEIFEPIVLGWFARYYDHPVWNRLRKGELNLNGFVAWVLHNYHVSRAAGKSGSRCAVLFPKRDLRQFFRSDVLEEFWHCDAFYFVRHPALSISDIEVKNYVPLPASLAFEQFTVSVAETDWLAHLLISYFQESSIRFYSDCQDFYKEVEESYGLPGFFKGWTAHMRLDFDHGHADNFIEIFSSSEAVPHEALVESLSTAWFAYSFLYSALDQIESEASSSDSIVLRTTLRGGVLDPPTNALCTFSKQLAAPDLFQLSDEIRLSLGVNVGAREQDAFLTAALVQALFLSMSFASDHDDLIVVGKLIESFPACEEVVSKNGISASAMAMASFLRSISIDPKSLLFLLQLTVDLGCDWATPNADGRTRLQMFLKALPLLDSKSRDQFSTCALQWVELLVWKSGVDERCPSFEI